MLSPAVIYFPFDRPPQTLAFLPPSTLLLAFVCLAVSFLYSGIEAGLLSMSRARLRSRVHQGEEDAIRLARLLAHPERLLATVLLVTNFADVAALILITEGFVRELGVLGYAWAGAVLLPVYLLGVQLLPKALFRRFPYRAVVAMAGLLEKTSRVLTPFLGIGSWVWRRWFAPTSSEATPLHGRFLAREDFKSLAAEGELTGALTGAERGMIHNVVDFTALPAREVMTPPPEAYRLPEEAAAVDALDAVAASANAGMEPKVSDLLDFAKARRLDQLPVVNASGELVALIDVFTLLLDRDPQRSAASYLRRPPLEAAPDDPAHRVLRRLRAARLPAAAVVEGETRFVGIIRTRELLQRLVRGAGA